MMNTHALVNINRLYKHLENENYEMLKVDLESYFAYENRKFVFNDREMMLMLSSLLSELANEEEPSELNNKITGALWHQVKDILETHKVIK